MALEHAGFEVRDRVSHFFGTGFPKSLDVSKAIDKAAGAEREVIGSRDYGANNATSKGAYNFRGRDVDNGSAKTSALVTAPATEDAKRWAGWGTALKPAAEDWWLARVPLEGTVAGNVGAHGTGALNINGCRIAGMKPATTRGQGGANGRYGPLNAQGRIEDDGRGRWPANVVLSHAPECTEACAPGCAVAALDEQSEAMGMHSAGASSRGGNINVTVPPGYSGGLGVKAPFRVGDVERGAHASRFFYCAKPSTSERNAHGENTHPTVKSIALMRYLVRLVTPPGGIVLDPFTGSGTTGVAAMLEGARFIGVEQDQAYVALARARIGGAL
jgi:site-specific DNA-methyltransferase (adenine-specific)